MMKSLKKKAGLMLSMRSWGVLGLILAAAVTVGFGQPFTIGNQIKNHSIPVYVGVIPKNPGQCPAGSDYLTIYMDDEDHNNKSLMSGWTGATSQEYTNHVNGTRLGFCRVDGTYFGNLGHENLINWGGSFIDPNKASVGAYDYLVLRLDTTCPIGSKEQIRIIDNEDDHNQNNATGNISPNNVHYSNKGKTVLYFCLFTPSFGTTMPNGFPDLGITYGVFAGAVAPPIAPGHDNYWLATGTVYTDDEDTNNKDSTTDSSNFSNDDIFAASAGVTRGGANTTFYIAKVRDITGLCSQPASWWNTSWVNASFDGANCFLRQAPSGSQPFVYANKYYIKPTPTMNCPYGSIDYSTGGCFIMVKPVGGLISNNSFYVPAGSGNSCPPVPPGSPGWTLTGPFCVLPAAWGTSAFVFGPTLGTKKFYTTTLPTCANGPDHGSFDGANCYMGTPPPGTVAFIWSNNFYYSE